MARFRVVSKHQVSGWRFLLSRMEHALARRDVSMLDDPARGRMIAYLVGVAMACVIVAGAAVMAFFKPAKAIGAARIIAEKDTGALFVNIDNRLYPALNLTSARLIVGSAANPVQVPASELSKYPRGPWVGIPGAPSRMIGTTDRDSSWAVCDTARIGSATPIDPSTGLPTSAASPVRTTVFGGQLTVQSPGVRELRDTEARLVREGATNWLIYRHPEHGVVRAMISLGEAPVLLALGLDAASALLPASAGLIGAIPEVPPLTAPKLPGSGTGVTLASGLAARVGSVLTVTSPDQPASYYAVTQAGVQRVSPVLAAILRNADPTSDAGSNTVSPNIIAANLRVGTLEGAGAFPTRPLTLLAPTAQPTTCFTWARTGSDAVARANLLVGTQLPVGKDAQTDIVNLVSSGKAAVADAAYMPRTSGRFVQVTGADADSPRQESLWWVAENGVRYGIDVKAAEHAGTDPVLQALGLGAPVPAPWSIISLFPAGPVLSQRDARLQHDGIAPAELVAPLPGSHVGG